MSQRADVQPARASTDAVVSLPLVLDSMPSAFYALDLQWRFVSLSSAAEALIGRKREDVLGEVVWELFPAAVGTVIEETYRAVVDTGRAASFEAYYPSPLDAWFEIRAHPVPEGLLVYFADVTARRAAIEAEDRSRAHLRLVAEVAVALAGAVTVTGIADALARVLVPRVADACVVTVADEQAGGPWQHRIRDVGSWPPNAVARVQAHELLESLVEAAPVLESFQQGRPILVDANGARIVDVRADAPNDVSLDLSGFQRAAGGSGSVVSGSVVSDLGHVVMQPLPGRSETVGVVTLSNAAARGPLADTSLSALSEIAPSVGQALDDARVNATQREFASQMQHVLLSELPERDDLLLAARYWPATEGVNVGGDWYDAFPNRDGSLSLVIGDVTGHGRSATAAMAQLRYLLRGIAYVLGEPPHVVLERLEGALDGLGIDTLATVVLASVSSNLEGPPGATTLRWSNAGHPPPVLLHPDGRAELLDTTADLLLGVDSGTRRTSGTRVLMPGSRVLLYTDGLIERRGEDLNTGLARLESVSANLSAFDLDALCDRLIQQMHADSREDDIAFLVAELTAATALLPDSERQHPPSWTERNSVE